MNEIESHPDYRPTFEHWLSVCLSAGRSRAEAEQRARGHAYSFVARRIERAAYYQGKRVIGPNPSLSASNP